MFEFQIKRQKQVYILDEKNKNLFFIKTTSFTKYSGNFILPSYLEYQYSWRKCPIIEYYKKSLKYNYETFHYFYNYYPVYFKFDSLPRIPKITNCGTSA